MPRTAPDRRTPRILRRAAIFAALGLATTLAVAWALSFRDVNNLGVRAERQEPWAYESTPRMYPDSPGMVVITRYRVPGAMILESDAFGPEYQPPPGIRLTFLNEAQTDASPESITPAWAISAALPWTIDPPNNWPRGRDWDSRFVEARGWPMLALYSVRRRTPSFTHEHAGAIAIPGGRTFFTGGLFGRTESVTLPWWPVWRGLAVNSALFGAAWFVLLAGPGAIRRALRRRRGQCTACGYDLRGTPPGRPCPECGAEPNGAFADTGGFA